MSGYIKDRTGCVFGRLTVVGLHGRTKQKMAVWECRCECGNIHYVQTGNLQSGAISSCGCLHRSLLAYRNLRHGDAARGAKPSEYTTWIDMNVRCYNPNSQGYKYYGGRGIKVSEDWKNSYESFLRDMGRKPSPQLTIDRIDPDGDYCKENCRWATWFQQNASDHKSKMLQRK